MAPPDGVTWCPLPGSVHVSGVKGSAVQRVRVSSTLDRPFGDRWVVARLVAVLVGQRPWNGPGCVELLTWCPAGELSTSWWTELKGRMELCAYMKKRAKKGEGLSTRSAADDEFRGQYPTLFDYLTATCYDDDPKQPRITATLLLFGQDGCWKACLRDRAECCCAWAAGPSITELFGVLERELADDTVVWRLDRLSGAPEATRKPRSKSS